MSIRTPLVLLAVAVAAAVALPAASAAAPTATAAATTCPGTFQVLHNDKIGPLSLPAGPYKITTIKGVTCSQSATLFNRFLQDWDGILPDGWKVKGSGFVQGTKAAFNVAPAKTPPPPPPPPAGQTCPGTVTLLHNDKINSLSLPKGNYAIQILKKGGKLSCDAARVQFSTFLTENYKTPLPAPWTLNASTATFSEPGGIGFRVVRTGGGTGGGGSTTGVLCPGTFQVLHNDRIGPLKVNAGPYYVYRIGSLTCQEVINDFRLDLENGNIPNKNWTLNPQTATFLFLKTKGFRVEPKFGT